jgi:hypothetical protein
MATEAAINANEEHQRAANAQPAGRQRAKMFGLLNRNAAG